MSLFSKTQQITLAVIAACFFFAASFLAFANVVRPAGIHPHFDWPDETMNAFFAKTYADTGTFSVPMLAQTPHDVIRPRSFNVSKNLNDYKQYLVPGAFLGLPYWYGIGVRIFGHDASLFFTPFLAMMSLLAFAYIVRAMFDARTSIFSAFFVAANPAWLYYANYSYLPNVPFVSALLFFVASCIAALRSELKTVRIIWTVISGLSLGIAISMRTNEALWIFVLICIVFFGTKAWKQWRIFLGVFAVAFASFLPVFFYQATTFGNPFVSGYSRLSESGTVTSPTEFAQTATNPILVAVSALTFPYGIHVRAVWFNVKNYTLFLAPWVSFPLLFGIAYYCFKESTLRKKYLLLLTVCVSTVWLFLSYGSWMTSDPLTRALNTIGDSHVRYWLPLVFLWTPFLGFTAADVYGKMNVAKILTLIFSGAYLLCSASLVYVSAKESIVWVAERERMYNKAAETIVKNTEPDAVIITSRTDKEIFPDRQVTPGALSFADGTIDAFPALYCNHPLYVYAMANDTVESDLSSAITKKFGLYAPDGAMGVFEKIAEPRPNYFLSKIRHTPAFDTLCVTKK